MGGYLAKWLLNAFSRMSSRRRAVRILKNKHTIKGKKVCLCKFSIQNNIHKLSLSLFLSHTQREYVCVSERESEVCVCIDVQYIRMS